jgi:hypothetical protein
MEFSSPEETKTFLQPEAESISGFNALSISSRLGKLLGRSFFEGWATFNSVCLSIITAELLFRRLEFQLIIVPPMGEEAMFCCPIFYKVIKR